MHLRSISSGNELIPRVYVENTFGDFDYSFLNSLDNDKANAHVYTNQ